MIKLATWNVNSLAVRLPQLLDWLAAHQPDVMVLQETKLTDDKWPQAAIEAAGYRAVWFGQKTYNGVALLAKVEPGNAARNIVGFADDQARVIAADVHGLRVVGAYFPNGQAPGSEKFEYKMQWLRALRDWLREELTVRPNLVLMGDFNITPDDRDVHDPVAWAGQIHCTPEEREQFRQLCALGVSQEPGLADRHHPGQRDAEGQGARGGHRQGHSQERAAERPCAGLGEARRRLTAALPRRSARVQSSRPRSWILRVMVLRPMPSF
jgi:exodeoxyribonuclease-3